MPLLTRRRVIAAKIETTPGTAIALSNTDAFYAIDAKVAPDIEYTERPDDGTLGQRAGVVGAKKGKVTFRLEMKGSGTLGTSPAWANILLPACGMVATGGNAWSPTSNTANFKTLTFGVYEDGIVKSICGAMGNMKLEGETGKPAYMTFEFEGMWVAPADAAMLTPASDAVKPPPFLGETFTIASGLAPISKFTLDLGNKIHVREDATAANGYNYAVITERMVAGKVDPEATLCATRNLYNEFVTSLEQAMSLTVGNATLAAPLVQFKAVTDGERSGLVTHELDFVCDRNTGDDELTITF